MKSNSAMTLGRYNGFTLIELIVVIVVLGILSTYALSRFQGRGGFAEYTYQGRIIPSLRNMQQRAMQDTKNAELSDIDSVYRLIVDTANGEFGPPVDGVNLTVINHADDSLSSVVGEIAADNIAITTLDINLGTSFTFLRFDGLGRPINNDANPDNSCTSDCSINIIGEVTATVCIESQGYIHGGNCE